MIGIILPQNSLFVKILQRAFIICFLELFVSTYLALVRVDNLMDEFKKKIGDGVSALMALILMCVTVPILLHMTYIISTYRRYLDDIDIKASYGHYYVDLKTR